MGSMNGGQGKVEIVYIDGEKCARKHLLDSLKFDKEAKHRFIREIELVQKIDSPNVIKILDFNPDDNDLYYDMPYYQESLDDYIRRMGDALYTDPLIQKKIFISILKGVKDLHSKGIIHRDIKPGNILMNGEDDIVVCDFGFSKDVDNSSSYTYTGEAFGTARYTSPEQRNDSKNVDTLTDIYSLGIVLNDITGRTRGVSTRSQLCRIADTASAIEKEKRYSNIDEFIKDVNVGYDIWIKEKDDIDKAVMIGDIAKGSISDLELIANIDQIINNPHYDSFDADQVYHTLSVQQYKVLEKERPDLCFQIMELIWEDYLSWRGRTYDDIDNMTGFVKDCWNKSELPKVNGYNVAKLANLAADGNRYTAMDCVAKLIDEISDNDDIETQKELLYYAKVSNIRKCYSNRSGFGQKNLPSWVR